VLYSLATGTAAKSGPITYMHNGRQYVVQALGCTAGFGRDEAWGTEPGGVIIAFTR
jgi:hypothetical protein